ncbi:MAG: hypothetical protein R2791_07165 [Saprospiraceae bacterium]
MRTKSCFLALAFLLLNTIVYAQREETVLGSRGWGLSGLWGGYTHHYTDYNGTDAFNRGGFFGFEFGKSLFVGWTHYSLRDDIVLDKGDNQRFDFRFNGGKIGYAFVPYKAVHPMINVELGRGRAKLAGEGDDNIFVIQPSVGVEVNVFRWFRLGLEGGYRFARNVDYVALNDSDLSSPYAKATLKLGFSWGRYHKRTNYTKNYED